MARARTSHAARQPAGAEPAQRAGADALYRALTAQLTTAGCFRLATPRAVGYSIAVLGVYGGAYALLLSAPAPWWRALAIATLAFVSVHAGFIAHEAGHGALTHNGRLVRTIGQVFNTLLTALCFSYFQHIHRRHHPHCNERERDPDMQSGAFSLYRESAAAKTGVGRLISRYQAYLIWLLVWLQGFTLKIDSVKFLCRNPRVTLTDQVVLAAHIVLWFGPPVYVLGLRDAVVNYVLMALFVGPYLGTIFLVNHIGTRVVEPNDRLSHLVQEASTTRNLGESRVLDFLFGGLNHHIEHHLFPTIPSPRLRAARPIIREFCRQHGIPYREMSWWQAAREVFRHLEAMSRFASPPMQGAERGRDRMTDGRSTDQQEGEMSVRAGRGPLRTRP